MPWKAKDASKFKKGLSPEQARKWASIANRVLKDTGDEAKAIRIANSQVKKKSSKEFTSPSGSSNLSLGPGTVWGGK